MAAGEAVGWLIDDAGPLEDALRTAWRVAGGEDAAIAPRPVESGPVELSAEVPGLPPAGDARTEAARKAILACIRESCAAPLAQALEIQAKHSAGFMVTKACRSGAVGSAARKTLDV